MAQSQHQNPELIEAILNAHGTLATFNKVKSIAVLNHASGSLFNLKVQPPLSVSRLSTHTITPAPVHTVVTGDRGPGIPSDERWIFTPKEVRVESGDGSVLEQHVDPTKTFQGHTRATKWDKCHLIYFSGYAMWNYFCTPFMLARPGFQTRELDRVKENGAEHRVLEVTFPEDGSVASHSRRQRFYFDSEKLLLRRLDYVVDVVGSGEASNYCFDYQRFEVGRDGEGIWFPTLRRALTKDATGAPMVNGLSGVLLHFLDVKIQVAETEARKESTL